jgi:alpha-ketoglutarate-dependent taurine dioxygenase
MTPAVVAQRGVVFFRNQDIQLQDQKILTQRLGELTGKPETSKLHKHVVSYKTGDWPQPEPKITDDEVTVIYSESNRKYNKDAYPNKTKKLSSLGWHAEYVPLPPLHICLVFPCFNCSWEHHINPWHNSVTFEQIPPDYSCLKLLQPSSDAGGDTVWASGYELYDRLSLPMQKLADSLTANHSQPDFVTGAKELGLTLVSEFRGAPENTGLVFTAEQ